MNDKTVLGAEVLRDFHRRFRVKAACEDLNISDYMRDVLARELGFLSYADYVQSIDRNIVQRNDKHRGTI